MRFYTQPHQYDCGIDLHARSLYLCILDQGGALVLHRHRAAAPEPFCGPLLPTAPIARSPWKTSSPGTGWLTFVRKQGMAFVRGPALYMQALHGGQAKNDPIDAHTVAVWRRGGLIPQAYGYPAEKRATRDRLRRRNPLLRERAPLLAPIQNTNSPDHLPEIGKTIADQTNRGGVAERFAEPSVPKRIEVDRALIATHDPLLTELELYRVNTAKRHDANAFYRLRSVLGIGKILALVRLDEIDDLQRFPRVQDVVSDGRLVKCAKESAGKRSGTSGQTIGNAHLQWAFSEAVVLFLRNNPQGPKYRARLERRHGQGQALTVLAHKRARAIYYRLKRATAFDRNQFLAG